jgi:hypothetical protein
VRVEGARVLFELEREDPAAFLARALADPRFPKLRALEYGQLSLADLYRDLYGVEGC